jgi:hypothetical protein
MHDMLQIVLGTALFFVGCVVLCAIGFTFDVWGQTRAARKSQRGHRAGAAFPSASLAASEGRLQDGERWTGTWHVEDGRLVVDTAWGSASERINDDTDQPTWATEMLRAMVAAAGDGKPGSA